MEYEIVFDTETSCLYPDEGQIAQLSYVMIDLETKDILKARNFYFTVDYMEAGASRANGLYVEDLIELSNGKRFKDHAEEIHKDFLKADSLIAHNLSFDLSFLREELKRCKFDAKLNDKKHFCTMEEYTDVLAIPHDFYGVKYPSLGEVISFLGLRTKDIRNKANEIFKVSADDDIYYHDARFDVVATMYAYLKYPEIDKFKYCNSIYDGIEELEYYYTTTKEFFLKEDIYKLDSSSENIVKEYSNLMDLENKNKPFKTRLNAIKESIDCVLGLIEKEENKLIRIRHNKLKKIIDTALSKKFIVKNARFGEYHIFCGGSSAYLEFHRKNKEHYLANEDVKTIYLQDNLYLMIRNKENKNKFNVIEVAAEKTKEYTDGRKYLVNKILKIEEIPEDLLEEYEDKIS